ncbi:hypothetical protein [Streptomyces flaveus]
MTWSTPWTAKLVAAAFGMDPQATLIYLADRVDYGRLLPRYPVTAPNQRL